MSFRIKVEEGGQITAPRIRDLYTLYVQRNMARPLSVIQSLLRNGGTIESLIKDKGAYRFVVTVPHGWKAPSGVRLQQMLPLSRPVAVLPSAHTQNVAEVQLIGNHLPTLRKLLVSGVRLCGFVDRKERRSLRSVYKIELPTYNRSWSGHPNVILLSTPESAPSSLTANHAMRS